LAEVITVTALNRYVKTLLDSSDVLFDLALRGEIANFVQNSRSGHCYFSLRDEQCSVKAVMFRSDAKRLGFRPEDGMRVVVRCRVTLYERDGAFQIYVSDMFPDGIGGAQMAFEQLKAKLDAEGLFAAEHKKALPTYPRAIGLVTSRTGAAVQDIRNVIGRRWPSVRLLLCPVNVQGFEAAQEIAAAIDRLDRSGLVDEIIVARGGGSREDLWVFNAEIIARAAYRCKTPLISAIGHEINFTILDFVADRRAPTPSAAAEIAVPDRAQLQSDLFNLQQNIHKNMQNRYEVCYNNFVTCTARLAEGAATQKIGDGAAQTEHLAAELQRAMQSALQQKRQSLAHASALADSLSPYRVLARGYTMLTDAQGDVCTVQQLEPGETITLHGSAAKAQCVVTTVEQKAGIE
jgi:exodeoxyribonuclease VII large subunit